VSENHSLIDVKSQWKIESTAAGVCVRLEKDLFRYYPYEDSALEPFHAATQALNVAVAVRVGNAAVQTALAKTSVPSFLLLSVSDYRYVSLPGQGMKSTSTTTPAFKSFRPSRISMLRRKINVALSSVTKGSLSSGKRILTKSSHCARHSNPKSSNTSTNSDLTSLALRCHHGLLPEQALWICFPGLDWLLH
jgi:hypothetical protein